jgi:hypothetical protein
VSSKTQAQKFYDGVIILFSLYYIATSYIVGKKLVKKKDFDVIFILKLEISLSLGFCGANS